MRLTVERRCESFSQRPEHRWRWESPLHPAGATILYSTTFAGSSSDYAVALDIDAAGAAYVFGLTSSADFPVTPGAFQTAAPANSILAKESDENLICLQFGDKIAVRYPPTMTTVYPPNVSPFCAPVTR
jgi:hypothetical protein